MVVFSPTLLSAELENRMNMQRKGMIMSTDTEKETRVDTVRWGPRGASPFLKTENSQPLQVPAQFAQGN